MSSLGDPFRDCPRFNICSVNECPLSLGYEKRTESKCKEDFELSCPLAKSIRVRIAAHYGNLKYDGLTRNEYAQREVWNKRPEDDRKKIIGNFTY